MYKQKMSRWLALSVTTAISLSTSAAAIAETDTRPSFGNTIIDAAELGDLSKVQNILANGGNPNQRGEFGTTPLMRAVHNNNLQLVNMLLSGGANADIKDMGGATAVTLAAREGYNEILAALIQRGANLNTADSEGFTPLMRAGMAGNAQAVQTLLQAGANVNLANNFGETALKQSLDNGRTDIAELLKSGGADDNLIIIPAKEKTQVLAEIAEDVDVSDEDHADIVVDFSAGKLSNSKIAQNHKPLRRQIASVDQNDYFVGSFYAPVKEVIAEPQPVAKPRSALAEEVVAMVAPEVSSQPVEELPPKRLDALGAALQSVKSSTKWTDTLRKVASIKTSVPYELASNEMMAPSSIAIINLGTFKTEEFANKKLSSLLSEFPAQLKDLSAKIVKKNSSNGIVYQINAGLTTGSHAQEVCRQIIASGVNCHAVSSSLQTQQEFNNYTGDMPVQAVMQNVDDATSAPSPQVEGKDLSPSAPQIDYSQRRSPINNFISSNFSAYAAEISPAAGEQVPNSAAPKKSILADLPPIESAVPAASKPSLSPTPINAQAQTPALKIIAPNTPLITPAPATATASPTSETLKTITPTTPAVTPTPVPNSTPTPIGSIAEKPKTEMKIEVKPAEEPKPAATNVTAAAPEAKAEVKEEVKTEPKVEDKTEVETETKTEEVATEIKAPVKKRFKRRQWRRHSIPAPGIGEPPKDLTSGQPLLQSGQFAVARPVKSAELEIPAGHNVWINAGSFASAAEAKSFWSGLQSKTPSLSSAHMRMGSPLANPGSVTLEVGPFASISEGSQICETLKQEGSSCSVTTDISAPRQIHEAPAVKVYVDDHSMPLVENYELGSGNWNVQLGVFSSYAEAQDAWRNISVENRHLKKMASNIIALDGKFRLRAGNFNSSSKADALCDKLRAQEISCIIIKN